MFAIYTPWEKLEKFCFTLPHFPLDVGYNAAHWISAHRLHES